MLFDRILRRLLGSTAVAFAASAMAFAPSMASAQTYPDKPINMVVPYPPGGASDVLARLLADHLQKTLGQPVIVVNRPGAGSLVGTQSVIRAPKDGYTLLFTGSALTIQAAINKQFDVKLERDLAPVSEVVRSTFLIATPASQPHKTMAELVSYAKANPGKLATGTNGAGTTSFMIFEYLKSLAKIDLLHVPYKGSSEAVAALLAGDVQLVADPVLTLQKRVEAGTLRGLAVTGQQRTALLPNVPTMAESGFPGFNITAWIGLLAPAGTPPAVVEKLGTATAAILRNPEVAQRAAALGFDPIGSSPAEFERALRQEFATWTQLARERNLQID